MQTVLHFNGQVVLKIHYRFLVSKIPKAKQLWADLSLHPKPPSVISSRAPLVQPTSNQSP